MSQTNNEEAKRRKYYPMWLWWGEVFWEPFVLAFFIFILLTHIQHIFQTATNISIFWQKLNEDMMSNIFLYIVFLIVFIIWVIYRAKRVSREFKTREEEIRLHTEMVDILKELKGNLKLAVKEALKEDREEQRKEAIEKAGEW